MNSVPPIIKSIFIFGNMVNEPGWHIAVLMKLVGNGNNIADPMNVVQSFRKNKIWLPGSVVRGIGVAVNWQTDARGLKIVKDRKRSADVMRNKWPVG